MVSSTFWTRPWPIFDFQIHVTPRYIVRMCWFFFLRLDTCKELYGGIKSRLKWHNVVVRSLCRGWHFLIFQFQANFDEKWNLQNSWLNNFWALYSNGFDPPNTSEKHEPNCTLQKKIFEHREHVDLGWFQWKSPKNMVFQPKINSKNRFLKKISRNIKYKLICILVPRNRWNCASLSHGREP